MHPLAGIQAKIRRAAEHIQAIEVEAAALLESDPPTLANDFDLKSGEHRVRITYCPEPPPIFGVLLGDVMHNLRSALDHLVWQLVLVNGESPGEWSQFPIFDRPEQFSDRVLKPRSKGKPSMLLGVSDRAAADIEQIQPYQPLAERHVNALAVVRDLSNIDKHRLVHAAVYTMTDDTPTFSGTGFDGVEIKWGPVRIREGAEIARYRLMVSKDAPDDLEVNVKAGFLFEVRFGDIGIPLSKVLEASLLVTRTLKEFADKYFRNSP